MILIRLTVFSSLFLSFHSNSFANASSNEQHQPTPADLEMAKKIATETAKWFEYTTGKMDSEKLGQCSDYALMFILKYNEYLGENVARLIVANNPIPSGTYKVGKKVDVSAQGFYGFESGSSGFLIWNDQLYLYHPVLGAYQIFLDKQWTPSSHFGVNMLDSRQIHVWATIGDVSVDPTYFDLWPDKFPSPLGVDK